MDKINKNNDDTEGFDINQGLHIIRTYSKSIIFITVLFAAVFSISAYFKPSMYFSKATLEVSSDNGSSKSNNPMLRALGYGAEQSQSAESLLTSRYLILKTLDKLGLGTRYYVRYKYKTLELYKESPFVVSVSFMEYNLIGDKIGIKPLDENTFELTYKTKPDYSLNGLVDFILSKPKKHIEFTGVYKFGQKISSPYFTIVVTKIRDFKQKEYFFSYVENEDMAEYIQRGLSTNPSAKYSSNVFIRFDDTVPLRAKDIVDGLMETYIEDSIEQKKSASAKSLKFIDKQLAVVNATLTESEKVLQGFKQRNDLIDLSTTAAIVSDNVEKLKTELNDLSSEESILENLKVYMEANEDLTGLTVQPLKITVANLNELIGRYRDAIIKRKAMLIEVTEFHPEIIKLNEEVYGLRKNIKATVILSLNTIKTRKEYLKKILEERKHSLVKIPEQERELGVLTRNSAANEKLYSFLLQMRVETAILNSSTIPAARIMDAASHPRTPYAPKKFRIILLGVLFGAIFGIALAFLRSYINNIINEITEIEKLTQVPIYGKIPYNRKNIPSIAYEEAFRTLRTNLEFMQVDKTSKTVLVASSVSKEGKSTTIKNMAEMLIRLDKKIIVLDFDLRRPSLHQYFDAINNKVGLSMLLSGQINLQECIQRTKDNIDIISAGPTPPNPSELIMSEKTDLLLTALSKRYDYILIDSPPYSIVTDAAILMKKSDIVLFSIMINYSKRSVLKQINSIVREYEIPRAGIILHGLKLKGKEEYGYGYFDS